MSYIEYGLNWLVSITQAKRPDTTIPLPSSKGKVHRPDTYTKGLPTQFQLMATPTSCLPSGPLELEAYFPVSPNSHAHG